MNVDGQLVALRLLAYYAATPQGHRHSTEIARLRHVGELRPRVERAAGRPLQGRPLPKTNAPRRVPVGRVVGRPPAPGIEPAAVGCAGRARRRHRLHPEAARASPPYAPSLIGRRSAPRAYRRPAAPYRPPPSPSSLSGGSVTMDEPPVAEAILIEDGTVAAVGNRDDVLALAGEHAPVINIGRNVAYPGIYRCPRSLDRGPRPLRAQDGSGRHGCGAQPLRDLNLRAVGQPGEAR